MLVAIPRDSQLSAASFTEVTGSFRVLRVQLAELDRFARMADTMEEELESFLESYYARVLPLTTRLERLRYRKIHGIFPPKHIMGEMIYSRGKYEQNPLSKRKKELFRSLAKRCHPDNLQASTSIDISEVYAAKTIGALWLLELRSVCEELLPTVMNQYLEQQYLLITGLQQEAQNYTSHMELGDMWHLKETIYDAALQGKDLIDDILCRIENQIAALQQSFVKSKEFESAA